MYPGAGAWVHKSVSWVHIGRLGTHFGSFGPSVPRLVWDWDWG